MRREYNKDRLCEAGRRPMTRLTVTRVTVSAACFEKVVQEAERQRGCLPSLLEQTMRVPLLVTPIAPAGEQNEPG